MATTYYNCPVFLGEGGTDTYFFVAQQASIEESVPILAVRGLGESSVISTIAENTLQGTINITYLLTSGSAGGYSSLSIDQVLKFSTINQTEPTMLSGRIGKTRFSDAILTSFSVDASAQGIISCSLSLAYFDPASGLDSGGNESEDQLGSATLEYGHGSESTADAGELSLNDNLFSFKLDLSESITPIKKMGTVTPTMLLKGGGEVTMTFVGNNLPAALCVDADSLCITSKTAGFTAKSCGGGLDETVTLPLTSKGEEAAYIVSRSIDVSEGNVLNGTAVLTQYF